MISGYLYGAFIFALHAFALLPNRGESGTARLRLNLLAPSAGRLHGLLSLRSWRRASKSIRTDLLAPENGGLPGRESERRYRKTASRCVHPLSFPGWIRFVHRSIHSIPNL